MRIGLPALAASAVLVIAGCGDSSANPESVSTKASSTAQPKQEPSKYTGSTLSAKRVARESYGASAEGKTSDGNKLIRSVKCNRTECLLSLRPDEASFSPEREYLEGARPLFKRIFALRSVDIVGVDFYAKLVTPGGKERVGLVANLTCDRSMHRQIDWDKVRADGLKAICIWEPVVDL